MERFPPLAASFDVRATCRNATTPGKLTVEFLAPAHQPHTAIWVARGKRRGGECLKEITVFGVSFPSRARGGIHRPAREGITVFSCGKSTIESE